MMRRQQELRIVGARHPSLIVGAPFLQACSAASLHLGGPSIASLGVTSAVRGEGRSSIAAAMAAVQQRDYRRHVLLLEMDFDQPSLATRLQTNMTPGLADVIRGEVSIDDALQLFPDGTMMITAGVASGNGARLTVDLKSSGLLAELTRRFEVVVADLPPLLESSFARVAAGLFDRTLLVVRAGVTPIGQVQEATAGLDPAPVVLLNGASTRLPAWLRRLTQA
jgi:succinoglycan biosynthesis transport protein ExoP